MTQDEFDAIAAEFGVEHPFEVGKRYGLTQDELVAHMQAHNDRIFNEWVTDYAKRVGRPVSEVRAEVIRQRQLTASHCNDVYRREVGIKESKEDNMTKKAANQTTIDMTENNEQEGTTMTENTNVNANTESKEDTTMTKFDIPRKANGEYDFVADRAKHAEIREATKLGRIKGIELAHAIKGKKLLGGLTNDPAELELLAKAAKKFGWSGRVLTVTQAGDYFGTPNPEYTGHGWLVKNKPYTNKEGRTTQYRTVVYPIEAFVFATEDGEPAFDEQKALEKAAKKAASEARKANSDMKKAYKEAGMKLPRRKTTSRKTTSRKPKTEAIADLPVPAAAPAHKFHVVLDNGTEFWADTPEEVKEYRALFE